MTKDPGAAEDRMTRIRLGSLTRASVLGAAAAVLMSGCGSSASSPTKSTTSTAASPARSQLQAATAEIARLCGAKTTPVNAASRLQSDVTTVVADTRKLADVRLAEPAEHTLDAPAPGALGGCLQGGAVAMEKRLLTPIPMGAAFNAALTKRRAVGIQGFLPLDQKYLDQHFLTGKSRLQQRCVTGTFGTIDSDLANFDYLLKTGDRAAQDLLAGLVSQCAAS